MKSALLVISFFATTAFAANLEQTLHAQVSGRVVLERSHTVTCLAINCPPSTPYYQLILDDAEVMGLGPVDVVMFQDFAPLMVAEKPAAVTYAGLTLSEGRYIILEADVRLNQYGGKTYAVVTKSVAIKFAPVRYPVMIY